MTDPLAALAELIKQPGTDLLRQTSDSVLQRRRGDTYTRPLIPGFENTMAEEILMVPPRHIYEKQIARGEAPHYVSTNQGQEAKKDGIQARAALRMISKVAMAVSWEASRQDYPASETNPAGGVYNAEEERRNKDGVASVWRGLNDRGQGSDTPEPPNVNASLTGFGGIKVGSGPTVERVESYRHTPESPQTQERKVNSLFNAMPHINPMTDEPTGENISKAAFAAEFGPEPGVTEGGGSRDRGKKPFVGNDSMDPNHAESWAEFDAYRPWSHAIIESGSPGPSR